MMKNPREPGRSDPDDPVELLRALARSRREPEHAQRPEHFPAQESEANKMEALRSLAQQLDRQLRAPDQAPPQPPWPHRIALASRALRIKLAGTWTALTGDLHGAAWLQRREGIIVIAAVAIVVLLGAGFLAWRLAFPRSTLPPAQTSSTVRAPTLAKADTAAISKGMTDCDAAAAQDPDSLNFFVLPLVPANKNDQTWTAAALQSVGSSFILLSSQDALDGLAKGTLTLRPGRFTFAVLDGTSGATYSWTSATGISRLAKAGASTVKRLKLGFDFSENQIGPQWSAEFQRERGTCYWVSVLVWE